MQLHAKSIDFCFTLIKDKPATFHPFKSSCTTLAISEVQIFVKYITVSSAYILIKQFSKHWGRSLMDKTWRHVISKLHFLSWWGKTVPEPVQTTFTFYTAASFLEEHLSLTILGNRFCLRLQLNFQSILSLLADNASPLEIFSFYWLWMS